MALSRYLVAIFSICGMLVYAATACSQTYPNKVIRIVNCAAGCSTDYPSRLIAEGISGPLGQPVIVEPRGGGLIPMETLAKAPPDGYTLLYQGGAAWLAPLFNKDASYDAVRDFAPITACCLSYNIVVVHPTLPVKSVKELIALAKARPGELNYSATTVASSGWIAMELFKYMAGVNIVGVNYSGGQGASNNALISGEVQISIAGSGLIAPFINAGKVRALAITSSKPSALFPRLPTVAASGLPGYDSGTYHGVFAPAKTPEPIITRLNREIVRYLRTQDAREKFGNIGFEILATTPEEFAAIIATDMDRIRKMIKAGIKM